MAASTAAAGTERASSEGESLEAVSSRSEMGMLETDAGAGAGVGLGAATVGAAEMFWSSLSASWLLS